MDFRGGWQHILITSRQIKLYDATAEATASEPRRAYVRL